MAKELTTNGLGAGEINIIRNILMGQQIEEANAQFNELKSRIDENHAKQQSSLAELSQRMEQKLSALEKSMDSRIQTMEGDLKHRLDVLSQKLVETSKNDKAELGRMLVEIGQKLID